MLRLALTALAALLILPTSASASLGARVDADGELVVTGTGLDDHVEIRTGATPDEIELRDPTGTETADDGCSAGLGTVTCTGVRAIQVHLREGDDVLGIAAGDAILRSDTASRILARGDEGDDVVVGGRGNDHLLGDAGVDQLDGDEGADLLDGMSGRDVVRGGAGTDALSARDGEVDGIDCGDGVDTLQADRQEPSGSCETVGPIVEGLTVVPGGPLYAGMTLTPSPALVDGSPARVSYAWWRCDAAGNACVNVGSQFEQPTGAADVGSTYRVQIAAVNDAGSTGMTSPPSAVVQARVLPPGPNPIAQFAAKVIAVAKPKVRRTPRGFTVDTGVRGTCRAAGVPCTVRLTARTAKARKRKTIVAGTARQIVAPGKSARLGFALRKDGAARLRKDKRLRIVLSVRVTQAGGRTVTQQMPLTLRAPR